MEWISVEERYPEQILRVLVSVNEGGDFHVEIARRDRHWWFNDADNSVVPNVTHWQPLPIPAFVDAEPSLLVGEEAAEEASRRG